MRVVILAGGLGTRISEETDTKPKPMVFIGDRPIIWHIMKIYSHFGFNEFVVCLGYKGFVIKEYFYHYALHVSNVTIDFYNGVQIHDTVAESWKVMLVDTGNSTMTGGRLRKIRPYIENADAFCATYGDGVADIDIAKLVAFHQSHGKLATVTAVRPNARFGALTVDRGLVTEFKEKPVSEGSVINGGFLVLSPKVLDFVDDDLTIWEREPMERLTRDRQLAAFEHAGFWQPMDTIRDRAVLEDLWASGKAPWKVWD